jgi:OmpA-OmpF porin, OOP family
MRTLTALSAIFFIMSFGVGHAADAEGCKDDPAAPRFEGAEIDTCINKKFESYSLITGKVLDYSVDTKKAKFASSETIEGSLTRNLYIIKNNASSLEVYRTYAAALKEAGFSAVFEADGNSIDNSKGSDAGNLYYFSYEGGAARPFATGSNHRYGSFRKKSDTEDIAVGLAIVEDGGERVLANIDVARPKAMQAKLVQVTSSEIGKQLNAGGKIAIYGILFDFNKAEIKPESKPALEQIAQYLKDNADAKLWVVGHTDNVGGQAFNQELSDNRANAVVDALRDDYDIKGKRLKGAGVGLLAPTASNATEEGRAKNRRVELIPQ